MYTIMEELGGPVGGVGGGAWSPRLLDLWFHPPSHPTDLTTCVNM